MERIYPDYEFHCKQGQCRHACCNDWPVTISMKEYYSLVGMTCSLELRRILDPALHVLSHPSQFEYAELLPRFDGRCRLLNGKGLCSLQMECGEDALPSVCCTYPRGIRDDGLPTFACACSCEAVVEMLLYRTTPLHFRPAVEDPLFQRIAIIQDRAWSLPERLRRLGVSMGVECASLPEIDELRFISLMKSAESLIDKVDEASRSVAEYCRRVLNYFGRDVQTPLKYLAARDHMDVAWPGWHTLFEHLLVNHMFFSHFGCNGVAPEDSWLSLCAIYLLLRLLCLGVLRDSWDDSSLVDVCSAAFRLIDHTDSERLSAMLVREMGLDMPALIRL